MLYFDVLFLLNLLLILFFAVSLIGQNIRVYNLNVAPHDAESVANLFEEYHSKGKRKSGNVILQRVQFQNNVTHRVLLTGDPNNWGSAIERPNSEWSAYLRGTRPFRRSTEGSYTASSPIIDNCSLNIFTLSLAFILLIVFSSLLEVSINSSDHIFILSSKA